MKNVLRKFNKKQFIKEAVILDFYLGTAFSMYKLRVS